MKSEREEMYEILIHELQQKLNEFIKEVETEESKLIEREIVFDMLTDLEFLINDFS